jgi:hypothetical protein
MFGDYVTVCKPAAEEAPERQASNAVQPKGKSTYAEAKDKKAPSVGPFFGRPIYM